MARQMTATHTGLPFTLTDGGPRFMPGKDAVHDSMAWHDLDGDGVLDLIAIATQSGNYEDTDHELVAIHLPSGNVGWRALPGEVSKKVSIVEGVVIASANSATTLRGLDPRTGQQVWSTSLPDVMKEDPFDGDDRAPAIAAVGAGLAAVECKDDTYHLIEARSGRIMKSGSGQFKALGAGVPALLAITDEDGEKVEIWDLARARCIVALKDISQVRVVPGPGMFGVIYHGALVPEGAWGVQVRIFDQASMNELGKCTLQAQATPGAAKRKSDDDDDDDNDKPEIRVGDGEYDIVGGCILAGNRLFFGSRWHGDCYMAQLVANQTCATRVMPAVKPGFKFRSMVWCSPVIATAWQKEKGTEKVMVVGHDPNTLTPVWQVEDLGGRHLDRVLHTSGTAILVPYNPGANQNEYNQTTNKCSMRHIDPASGAVVTEYPVEDVECVEMHGPFLCGAPTYFSGGVPIVYDTNRRERVL